MTLNLTNLEITAQWLEAGGDDQYSFAMHHFQYGTRLGRKGVYQTRPPEADQILNNLPFDQALAIWSAQA